MVTEKNKEQFEKYLYDYYVLQYGKTEDLLSYAEMIDWVSAFNVLPFEMKIGVYLAYYDSLGYYIEIKPFETPKEFIYQILVMMPINSKQEKKHTLKLLKRLMN